MKLKIRQKNYDKKFDFNETVNTFGSAELLAKGLEIRHEKSMLAGFIKYLPLACIDYIVPRFAVSCSRCTISRDLLRFGWLSSDSVKCKDLSCI